MSSPGQLALFAGAWGHQAVVLDALHIALFCFLGGYHLMLLNDVLVRAVRLLALCIALSRVYS